MPRTEDAIRAELLDHTIADPVLAEVLEDVWQVLGESEATATLEELQLCTLDPLTASQDLLDSGYFTASCLAMRDQKLIVMNERFLLELEAAIRSFAQAESIYGIPQLKDDALMFGWVNRIEAGLAGMLGRLRRQATRDGSGHAEAMIRRELRMVVLFFLGHELGHVLGGHPTGEYAAFVDPALPLEKRVDEAVVKLCRHVDEFNREQFALPGFEKIRDPGSDIRTSENRFRARDPQRYEQDEAFFAYEAAADAWADRIVIEHLNALAEKDPIDAELALYLFVRGVFAAAVFSWYRDLAVFGRKLGVDAFQNAGELMVEMMKSREQYVHAASLFGEFHRFTLLRAVLGMKNVLRLRTTWFDQPIESRSIQTKYTAAQAADDQIICREWWLAEALQRYVLLCISMDTAIKIANVGCATGWILDADRKRGTPQMFVMQYETIGQAVARLRRVR